MRYTFLQNIGGSITVWYNVFWEAARRGAFKPLFLTGGGGIALLLLSGLATAHSLASAAYRPGIPPSQAVRGDLAQATMPSHPTLEENHG